MTEKKILSQGVSAPRDWWDKVQEQADELNVGRSEFIRLAVDRLLQDEEQLEEMKEAATLYRRVFSPV